MARWVISALLGGCLIAVSLGALSSAQAQSPSTTTPTPAIQTGVASAVVGGPIMPETPVVGQSPRSALVLTLRDNGGTFTVPVGTLIFLQIPRTPFYRLSYDPAVLRLIDIEPLPQPLPQQPPTDGGLQPPGTVAPQIFPAPGWRLVAIGPGVTDVILQQQPCTVPPCPMIPIFNFRVTIVVRGGSYVTPVPPPPPVRSDIYISTAYLNQTITVQVGQVITLDLPFLSPQQAVYLQYNPAVLQPLPGQDFNHAQPGGWHFVVTQPGTSILSVQGNACIDGNIDCAPSVLFQVTITTSPSTPTTGLNR